MNADSQRDQRFDEILAIYLNAEQEGHPPDREEYIAAHPEFADDLTAFFADHDRFKNLAEPATAELPPPRRDVEIGDHIRYFGDYELLEEIARGGMGVVFRAKQISLNRVVALKMIIAGHLATPADVQRFRSEAEAAASLDHPNIVPLYEVGDHLGQHYYTMKLIEGGDLRKAISSQQSAISKKTQRAAAKLMATVARAVHYAHQRGILHRDLKPANILLQRDEGGKMKDENDSIVGSDSSLVPHVTDFGLAKRLRPASSGEPGALATGDPPLLTLSGAIVGTPNYMAPEQATPHGGPLTVAADVYSLGAILYELLTGKPPFPGTDAVEVLRKLADEEPRRPQSLNPNIDADLQTICLKCLRKESGKRYASAETLADDLERWMNDEPILARPVGQLERAVKWVRRNKVVAGLGFGVVAALCAIASITSWMWISEARHALDIKQEKERTVDALLAETKTRREAQQFATSFALESFDRTMKQFEVEALRSNKDPHGEHRRPSPVTMVLLARALQTTPAEDIDTDNWIRTNLALHAQVLQRQHAPLWTGAEFWNAEFGPDGSTIVTRASDQKMRLFDTKSGQLKHIFNIPSSELQPIELAFSPTGRYVAAGLVESYLNSQDLYFGIWDTNTGEQLCSIQPLGSADTEASLSVRFSPDERFLICSIKNWFRRLEKNTLWNISSKKYFRDSSPNQFPFRAVTFNADGSRVLTVDDDNRVLVSQPDSDAIVCGPIACDDAVSVVALDSLGGKAVIGYYNGTSQILDIASARFVNAILKNAGPVENVEFDADATTIVTYGGNIRAWDATGRPLAELPGEFDGAFTQDRKTFVTIGNASKSRLPPITFAPHRHLDIPREFPEIRGNRVLLSYDGGFNSVLRCAKTGRPFYCGKVVATNGRNILADNFLYDLSPIAGDVPLVVLWTEVVSRMQIDLDGKSNKLDEAAWQSKRMALEKALAARSASRAMLVAAVDELHWCRAEARECIEQGELDGGIAALNRLIPVDGTWRNYYNRARAQLLSVKYDSSKNKRVIYADAAKDVLEAMKRIDGDWYSTFGFDPCGIAWPERDGFDIETPSNVALLQLAAGNTSDYRNLCSRLMQVRGFFQDYPGDDAFIVTALAPRAVEDYDSCIKIAEKARADSRKQDGKWRQILGYLCYRAGRYEEAHRLLSEFDQTYFRQETLYFRAMASYQLNRHADTKRDLAAAKALESEKKLYGAARLRRDILKAEAESLCKNETPISIKDHAWSIRNCMLH